MSTKTSIEVFKEVLAGRDDIPPKEKIGYLEEYKRILALKKGQNSGIVRRSGDEKTTI